MNADRGPSLVEAATYIDAFRDQLVVVKLGGELLDGGPVIERILPQIIVLYRCGLRPLLVHGGGRQVDAACRQRGIQVLKHRGRRVTTPEVLEVLVEVASALNRSIVDRLRRDGVPAQGFAEDVTDAIRCSLRDPTDEGGETVDWGLVGDITGLDADALPREVEGGFRLPEEPDHAPAQDWIVPVLPSLGTLPGGQLVNVNADAVASRLASDLGASKLVLLTGVAGILEQAAAAGPISELTTHAARDLVDQGVIAGGMRAKVEEALRALDRGVARVHIISGREPATLLREIFTDEGCGTLMVP